VIVTSKGTIEMTDKPNTDPRAAKRNSPADENKPDHKDECDGKASDGERARTWSAARPVARRAYRP
jgi:hypothetical protein